MPKFHAFTNFMTFQISGHSILHVLPNFTTFKISRLSKFQISNFGSLQFSHHLKFHVFANLTTFQNSRCPIFHDVSKFMSAQILYSKISRHYKFYDIPKSLKSKLNFMGFLTICNYFHGPDCRLRSSRDLFYHLCLSRN